MADTLFDVGPPKLAEQPAVQTISFFVPGRPVAKQSTRFSMAGRRSFPSSKVVEAEAMFAARCVAHKPAAPWPGPVRALYVFVFARPGWPRWKGEIMDRVGCPHMGRPDRGNLIKLVEDSMQGIFYIDDSQVYDAREVKRYGPEEGIHVTLWLEEPIPEKRPT